MNSTACSRTGPSMIDRLLLATTNPGKVTEIREALSGLEIDLLTLADWGAVPEPEETGNTFGENARLKATYYSRFTGLPALADDSGLLVEALAGRPGVHSSRYAPTDAERIQRLLRELASFERTEERAAKFVCAVCLAHGDYMLAVAGEVRGHIAPEPAGSNGFGYDPVFFYPPLERTFGELDRSLKNRVSHRAVALRKLRDKLTGPSAFQ